MECADVYIPIDRRLELAGVIRLTERTGGAALFADISGFTPLTAALVQELGPKLGAEELTRQLNMVYDTLIAEVHCRRGNVISFSGDAITCWFDGDHDGVRATACALAMQQAMDPFTAIATPSMNIVSLAMKAAVATGPVRRLVVGDPQIQSIDVLAGATLDRMAETEQHAGKGEVVVSPETIAGLGSRAVVSEWRDHHQGEPFAVVSDLRCPVPLDPWPTSTHSLPESAVRPWLLPPVYDRITSGHEQFLAEIRPCIPLFIRFDGIDYDDDPDAGTKLDAYIRWVQGVLHKYGGFLIQLTVGDKGSYLYSAFGALVAYEDDPLRAMAAALELRSPPSELAFIRHMQLGMTRGEMRTGAYGGATRRTYGVLGDEVNLAARLMLLAKPGQILVSSRIVHAATQSYQFKSIGLVHVKGKREPIAVSLAVGKRPHQHQQAFPIAAEALIGREAELQAMHALLERVLAGTGQILRLVGVAGIGKSHLSSAYVRQARQHGLRVFTGVCQSISQGIAYTPWRQVFRSFFALTDEPATGREGVATLDEQIAQVQTTISSINPDWLLRLPLLGDILDLPIPDNETTAAFDPRTRQEALFALAVEMIQHWATYAPLVLLLEDVHWMDEPSLGLTLALSHVVARTPLLLMLVHRPMLDTESMGTVDAESGTVRSTLLPELNTMPGHHAIHLRELSPDGVTQLVHSRLHGGTALPLVHSLIQAQTLGNPFFVKELVDTMRQTGKLAPQADGQWVLAESVFSALYDAQCLTRDEQGNWVLAPDAPLSSASLGLPLSVQGVVLSRIDRLPDTHKLTLKVASVIGRVFTLDVLARAHPSHPTRQDLLLELESMERQDFVYLGRDHPLPVPVYMFKHTVTLEVAYGSLLEVQQRELHLAVGATLEQVQPDAVEQLAYHYSRTTLRDKTLVYLERAARKMQREYANETALHYYRQALALEARWEWLREMVSIYHILGRRTEEQATLEALEAFATVPACEVAYLWGSHYEALGNYTSATEATTRALGRCEQVQDAIGQVRCLNLLGMIARRQGDYTRSRHWYDQAINLVQLEKTPAGSLTPESAQLYAQVLKGLGSVHIQHGNYADARSCYELALMLTRTSNNRKDEADVLNSLGVIADSLHNTTEAMHYYEQGLHLRRAIGDRAGEGGSLLNLAILTRGRGNYSQARNYLQAALSIQQDTGNRWEEVNVRNDLGILYIELGYLAQARDELERGLALSQDIGDEAGQAYILTNLGTVVRDQGDLDTAARMLNDGLALARQQDDRYLKADMLNRLATVDLLAGNHQQAIAYAEEALELWHALDIEESTTVTLATCAAAHLALGHTDEARTYAQQAVALLDRCGGEGMEAPQQDYFTCYRVLSATGDTDAAHAALRAAHALVMHRAEQIDDPALRQSFLEQVAINREVLKHSVERERVF